MSYELKKIAANRYIMLLLIAAVVLNAGLFYSESRNDRAGYTLAQMCQKYDWSVERLERENEELEARIVSGGGFYDPLLVTGDIFNESALNSAVLARKQEVLGYRNYLRELQEDTLLMIESGLFGDEGSFDVRSMKRSYDIYERLQNVTPSESCSVGVELLPGSSMTDLLFLLFPCSAAILLTSFEEYIGFTLLTKSTKHGRSVLYLRKLSAMAVICGIGFCLTYGVNLVLAASLYGLGDLSAPVQSVYGLRACPMHLSAGAYLAGMLGLKLLWCLAVATLFFAICCFSERMTTVLPISAGIALAALALGNGSSRWLRTISLTNLSFPKRLFQDCVFLNLFGVPFRKFAAAIIFLALLLLLSFFLGLTLFCGNSAPVRVKKRNFLLASLCSQQVSLFLHEGYKFWILCRAALIVALLLILQISIYGNQSVGLTDYQYYYQQYAKQLAGPPSEEKDAYIEIEQQRYELIRAMIQEGYSKDGSPLTESQMKDLQESLRPEQTFEEVKTQYLGLRDGQEFVNKYGYEDVFGKAGLLRTVTDTAKLFFVLTIVLSQVFAVEYERGMNRLQRVSLNMRRVTLSKLIWTGIFVLMAVVIAYLPQYLLAIRRFGLPQAWAAANSLSIFSQMGDAWSLGGVLVLSVVIRLALGCIAATVILLCSEKTRESFVTTLISLAALLVPLGIAGIVLSR